MAIRPPTPGGGELRPTADLEALLTEARRDLADKIQPHFARGIIAAATWVLGGTPDMPLTDRVLARPTVADVRSEEEFASRLLHGELGHVDLPRSFIVGVEHTLMWARGVAQQPPVELDDAWMDRDPYVA